MKRLVRRATEATAGGTESTLHESAVLNRIFALRGIRDAAELQYSLANLEAPHSLKGVNAAATRLVKALQDGERILIVGDFDADGATSCTLMVRVLSQLGARSVDYLVPNRFEYGYGLTPEIVDVAVSSSPDLIVTVDNGVSSIDGVAHARELGMDVIITDHHLAGHELPRAIIVNPNQAGCDFPSKHLAGVGVAFYVLLALRAQLRAVGWFDENRAEPVLADELPLVALGTVADVVPLDFNNRILVAEGLRRIRGGRCPEGLMALIHAAGVDPDHLRSSDLAFSIAPRLNAAGRLDDISLGIECLLTTDAEMAAQLAGELDRMNRDRRDIEDEMKAQVASASEDSVWYPSRDAVGICLFEEGWHQGVVGIVASRIKERVHRPVIAFADAGNGEIKGSARSIPGLHIRDALDSIAVQHQGLVRKFGGHAMAAGLTLLKDDLVHFAEAFNEEAKRWLSADDLEAVVLSDGEMGAVPDLALARDIVEGAPWGQGFPEPVFDDEFEIIDQRIVGTKHLKLQLRPIQGEQTVDAICFNQDRLLETRYRRMAYRLDINRYRGRASVQYIVTETELA